MISEDSRTEAHADILVRKKGEGDRRNQISDQIDHDDEKPSGPEPTYSTIISHEFICPADIVCCRLRPHQFSGD
jgi:hypothetical protein